MSKIGRNKPCPCGSGKKYKKCCMLKKQVQSFTRSMVQQKTSELLPKLLDYAYEEYSEETITEAWADFYDDDDDISDDNPYLDMFYKWFLFFWFPENGEDADADILFPSSETVGACYLRKNRTSMDSLSVRILESTLTDPICYWQVIAVEPNKGVLVKDLFFGRERFVEEISGSQEFKLWDIILANMQEIDHIFIFNIIAPFMLPSNLENMIRDHFFTDIEETDSMNQLFDLDLDLIFFYQDILDEMFAASMPELQNMDGSKTVMTKSTYKFKLSSLKEIQNLIEKDEAFETVKKSGVETYLWMGPPERTAILDVVIKGDIKIEKTTLISKCNSAERDNELRDILQVVLGELLTHHKTESEPHEFNPSLDSDDPEGSPSFDLDSLPSEARDQIVGGIENMFMKWADQAVPALNDLTPREAVKTPEGKEQVIDLINDWENETADTQNKQFSFDFNLLRENLGIKQ